jgi:hypothetical protein
MHPGIVAMLAMSTRAARHELSCRCSFVRHAAGGRGFLRRRGGPSLIISCKNSKNSEGAFGKGRSRQISGDPVGRPGRETPTCSYPAESGGTEAEGGHSERSSRATRSADAAVIRRPGTPETCERQERHFGNKTEGLSWPDDSAFELEKAGTRTAAPLVAGARRSVGVRFPSGPRSSPQHAR